MKKQKLLTEDEQLLATFILDKVVKCLEVDEILSESKAETVYSNGGRFVFSIHEMDFKRLKSAINKISGLKLYLEI
jgi:hypothetical protein